MNNIKWFLLLLAAYTINSCYSFKSAGIPPNMQTFYIAEVDNVSSNVVPTLATDFGIKLSDQIRREGKLVPTEIDPHVEFIPTVTAFRVTSVAPEEGQTTAFNRLDISIKIEFINNLEKDPNDPNEPKKWTQNFGFFEDYASDVNLLDIQEDLIDSITDQIVEDIFNKAFSDW